MNSKVTVVRQVWAENLYAEMCLIRRILPFFPCVSMDTEFPGTVFSYDGQNVCYSKLSPVDKYKLMKANVDVMNLIQVGLTLSSPAGQLPDFGTNFSYIWEFNFREFNFRDFDIDRDVNNAQSIKLLKEQEIDFQKNKEKGIDSRVFGTMLMAIGMVNNGRFRPNFLTWITFHGSYDFGFLVKLLIQRDLPDQMDEFLNLVQYFFGHKVFDIKYMIKFCDGIYGGLEKVANALDIERSAGKSHQAGSDSILTSQTFFKILGEFFGGCRLNPFAGVLYGFEISTEP